MMATPSRAARLLGVLTCLAMLAGCNRPTATPSLTVTPPAVVTDAAEVEIPPPPPAGLVDALQAQVKAGEMTREQAVVSGLQILSGELDPAAALGESPTSFEGTGVAFDAQRYLLYGTDEATKVEIARLLPILAPLPEVLLPYSVHEGASHSGGSGLARPAAQQDCRDLYAKGFPTGSSAECFVVKETESGSSTIQIFLPAADQPEGYDPAFADAALQAVLDSLGTYSALEIPGRPAVMKDIQVVFSLLDSARGTTLATVPTDPGQEPCQIILFPLAMTVSQADDPTSFQQTVAHEVFHCYQVWNYPAMAQNALWGVQDWWGESTATYFSNVVYPAANEEWGWIEDWSYNSGATSLVYSSYDNFGFFQFLANRIGNAGILEMIHSLEPAAEGDEAAQEALLAAFPGIQDLFVDYAVAFMDGTIVDASGATIPTAPAFVLPMFRIDASDDALIPFGTTPFTLTRYGVTFGSRQAYDLQPMASLSGYAGLRPINDVGKWVNLPTQVLGACTPRRYYVLMANAVPSSGDLGFGLTVTAGEPLDCGFTPTPPLAATEVGQAEATLEYCAFGYVEAGTTLGYGCEDDGFRAWINNDDRPYEFAIGYPGEVHSDVRIEVDARTRQSTDESGAVVVCRGNPLAESGYYFRLNGNGLAMIEFFEEGEDMYSLFINVDSAVLRPDVNRLRVECVGSHLAFYVNDTLVLSMEDERFADGDVGLGAGGGSNGLTEVRFDNFVVSQP